MFCPRGGTQRWPASSHGHKLQPFCLPEARGLPCEAGGSRGEGVGLKLLECWWCKSAEPQHTSGVLGQERVTLFLASIVTDNLSISNEEMNPNTWCVVKALEFKSWKGRVDFFEVLCGNMERAGHREALL